MSNNLKEAINKRKIAITGAAFSMDPNLIEAIIRHILDDIQGDKGDPGEKGDAGYTPSRTYLLSLIKPLIPILRKGDDGKTPQKGIDYFDGVDAEPIDEEKIIQSVLARIQKPKNDQDVVIDQQLLRKLLKKELDERDLHMEKKKIMVKDIPGLSRALESLRVARNLGGHGGTIKRVNTTSVGSGVYNLSRSVNPNELQVFVGGARLFEENGDFSYPAGAHVSRITLAAQFYLQVQAGTVLNVRGK